MRAGIGDSEAFKIRPMADFIPPGLKRFRTSIVAGAIAMFLLTVVFTFIGGIWLHGFDVTVNNWRYLLRTYLVLSAPLSFFSSLMLARLNPVAFSNGGIYGYTLRGKKFFFPWEDIPWEDIPWEDIPWEDIPWEDILQARRFRFLNLRWLRIYSKTSKNVLWLPLFQSRPVEFLHEIGKFAPPDSPIRNHLRPGIT